MTRRLARLIRGETLTASVAARCQTFNTKRRHKDETFLTQVTPIGTESRQSQWLSSLSAGSFGGKMTYEYDPKSIIAQSHPVDLTNGDDLSILDFLQNPLLVPNDRIERFDCLTNLVPSSCQDTGSSEASSNEDKEEVKNLRRTGVSITKRPTRPQNPQTHFILPDKVFLSPISCQTTSEEARRKASTRRKEVGRRTKRLPRLSPRASHLLQVPLCNKN